MTKTALYRHFDRDGTLLYVGVSMAALHRLAQHRDRSGWFESISNVTIEYFGTRQEAIEAECSAIKNETPKFNSKHVEREPQPRLRPLTPAEITDARAKLGAMWGKGRPLYAAELARSMRLNGRDPGATVLAWETGKNPMSGPASCLLDLYLSGVMPPAEVPVNGPHHRTGRQT